MSPHTTLVRPVVLSLIVVGTTAIVAKICDGKLGVGVAGEKEPHNDRRKYARLIAFKRYQYSILGMLEAISVGLGVSQPHVSFQVLKDPPSIFINWEIIPEKKDELWALAGPPKWMEMKPISIIEGEQSRYFLSCNVYEVKGLSGLLYGYRAEWSVYAGKPDAAASFLVIEARHSALSQDAVNGFVSGTPLEHSRNHGTITSFVHFSESASFRSVIRGLDGSTSVPKVHLSREWIAANDLIYWRNGVADKVVYNGGMVKERLLSVDPLNVSIEDSTYFASFVKPTPVSVLVFETELNFVVSPWHNLDKPKR